MVGFSFIIFILGLAVGSFLNVLIYRLPHNISILGRSFCPKCKKKIHWYDNIPLLSFVLLRGKCRSCHSPIGWQYPVVEIITAAFFVLVYLYFPSKNLSFIIYHLSLISAFIVIFFTDFKYGIIPDKIIYPAIIISVGFSIFNSQLLILNYLLSALGAFAFLGFLHLITRGRGMGLGDVKLAFLMGLLLGFPKIIVAFYLSFLTGAAISLILVLAGKKKFGQTVPFGPFLVAGTLIALFWGAEIIKQFNNLTI